VRTLDALHLATAEFMSQDHDLRLATFDQRMQAGARALHIPFYDL
jgi:predicted nucleic acid-binding protein